MDPANDFADGVVPIDRDDRDQEIFDLIQENIKLKRQLKEALTRGAMMEDRAIHEMEQKNREARQKESAVKREEQSTGLYDRVVEAQIQTVRKANPKQVTTSDLKKQLQQSQQDLRKSKSTQDRLQQVALSQRDLLQEKFEHEQVVQSLKRSASSTPKSRRPGKKARNSRTKKHIPCSKCYVNGLECDEREPCCECLLNNKSRGCKRVKCKKYSKGACKNSACLFAHEEDGYKHVTAHIKLRRKLREAKPESSQNGIGENGNINADDNASKDDSSDDSEDSDASGNDHDTGGVALAVAM